MSRALASGNFLNYAGAPLTAVPLTVACWFNPTSAATSGTLASINDGTQAEEFLLFKSAAALVQAVTRSGGTSRTASTSTTYSAGAWSLAVGVYAAANSRAAYLNGGGKGTETTSSTPAGLNSLRLGLRQSAGSPFVGSLAHAAIWNAALSDADVALLATGALPVFVQRANLIAYWPLRGLVSPEPDLVGSFPLTLTGTTEAATHPPVIYPQRALHMRRMAT